MEKILNFIEEALKLNGRHEGIAVKVTTDGTEKGTNVFFECDYLRYGIECCLSNDIDEITKELDKIAKKKAENVEMKRADLLKQLEDLK